MRKLPWLMAAACGPPDATPAAQAPQLLATWPSDAAMAVPADPNPVLLFAEPVDAASLEHLTVTLEGHDFQAVTLPCELSDEGWAAVCDITQELRHDHTYGLNGSVDDLTLTSLFTTDLPDGLAWNVGDDLRVERAGGSADAPALLEQYLFDTSGDATVVFVADDLQPADSLPWEGRCGLAQARVRPGASGDVVLEEAVGTTLSGWGLVGEDERLLAKSEAGALPITVDGQSLFLPVLEVKFAGELDPDADWGLVWFTADAVLPGSALDQLTEASPDWAVALAEAFTLIELDRDTDGDGVFDAAVLRLAGSGTRTTVVRSVTDP